MCNPYREPSIDASYQVSVHLAKGFQRRRSKRNKFWYLSFYLLIFLHVNIKTELFVCKFVIHGRDNMESSTFL
jgi:hypothetical protein